MIEIESGRQLPVARLTPGPGVRPKYPFAEMLVGESFWTPTPQNTVATGARTYGRRHGLGFTTRAETREGVPNRRAPMAAHGTRVWRVR